MDSTPEDLPPNEAFLPRSKKKINRRDLYLDIVPTERGMVVKPARGSLNETEMPYPKSTTTAEGKAEMPLINADIWFHVANYIEPAVVRTFALICRQTNDLVHTRHFWWHLYKRYCGAKPNGWHLMLPEHMQYKNLEQCDAITLRINVIKALYLSYRPLMRHIKDGYSLDVLLGRTYMSSWSISGSLCEWILCYKFWNRMEYEKAELPSSPDEINHQFDVYDWESLVNTASQHANGEYSCTTDEGTYLLLIIVKNYMPFPTHLLYGAEAGKDITRLTDYRQRLSKDMSSYDLELDFITGSNRYTQPCTIKYQEMRKCMVLPWWHPNFNRFMVINN